MNLDKPKKLSKLTIILLILLTVSVLIAIVLAFIIINDIYNQNSQRSPSIINRNKSDNSVSWDKPIIYLYPEETLEVEVKLGNPEYLSCTYPKYENGWKVIANPDGSLIDKNTERNLYALYWEGKNIQKQIDISKGFCIKGEDTAKFLEEKLEILGLTEREAEEFIIYWLPKMENNKYNYIRFETKEEQNSSMPLEVTPKPDSVIRIMMDWKALDEKIEIKEQELITPERKGFTVVEWGGTELK